MTTSELKKFALNLEKVLKEDCASFERIEELDEDGVAWKFMLESELWGDIVLQNFKDDDDGVSTVTISLRIADITDFPREKLFDLLEVNGSFHRASFSLGTFTDPDDESEKKLLFIDYKSTPEVFKPEEFTSCIDHLIDQLDEHMPENLLDSGDESDDEEDDGIDLDALIEDAKEGDPDAMYLLGRVYFAGDEDLEIPSNRQLALELLNSAASKGHKAAKKFLKTEVAYLDAISK